MKKNICLLIILFAVTARAQEVYTIVKVSGKVENGKLGREVRTGDRIEAKDALRFDSPGSYLIIISPKTGRKVIRGVPDSTPREIFKLLQSFVKPEERSTATRSSGMTYLEQLANSLDYDTLLILGDGKIPVNTQNLPLNPPSIVRAAYLLGTKYSYQKISDDKAFYLTKASLFPLHDLHTFPRIVIEYVKNENEDAIFNPGTPIGAFVPAYVNEAELKYEIVAIIQSLGPAPPKTILTEVKGYIVAEYGGVQGENLNLWLKQNKLVKD